VVSIYDYNTLDATVDAIKKFQGGKAIFVMPPVPIKCAGAPQKIMYLAEEIFREQGVRHKTEVYFATAGKAMFGIPTFAEALDKTRKRKNIEPLYQHKLLAINGEKKEAKFLVTDQEGKTSEKVIPYDLLHVVPMMRAHEYVEESGLAFAEGDQKGWLEVDKQTLQHLKFKNIFGIGDVTGVPNSKTGAAIRAQYPIVAENLWSVMNGKNPEKFYNGYSSCPLITEKGKVMLAEFGYDGKLLPTFPLDPTVERASMWYLKKDLLPLLYWYGMMKGWA
jgi:sulfide:quinone oxidoreductase